MAPTARYRALAQELSRLRQHFLPKQWDPTGIYSSRKLDRVRAYRLLVHAEIEDFIETILLTKVEMAVADWSSRRTVSSIVLCLIAAAKLGWDDPEAERLGIVRRSISKAPEFVDDLVNHARNQYRETVKENNGIKERNLKQLLLPIGIPLSTLDTTWLSNMSSFGGLRGSVAHRSRIGLKEAIDPKSELETVEQLLPGLKSLDAMVEES